jgi:hypothetical protein
VALKDLVVSHAELTEEQIEKIVADYARYDPTAKSVVLLPSAMDLSNKQRVIVYLVALRGWPFVLTEDTPPTNASPAELERALQIAGGSLRPILKELKDSRLIEATDGRYSANPVTFPFLETQLQGSEGTDGSRATTPPRSRTRRKHSGARPAASTQVAPDQDATTVEADVQAGGSKASSTKRRGRRDATAAGGGPLVRLRQLIAEGWFSEPRTTKDIVNELATRGASYRGQDLTRQMITLTRSTELRRTSQPKPGSTRPVWHYQA